MGLHTHARGDRLRCEWLRRRSRHTATRYQRCACSALATSSLRWARYLDSHIARPTAAAGQAQPRADGAASMPPAIASISELSSV
jgi:hypothetical protein